MQISRRGFTLIELLVVIAIIAILSVVVILTLNPSELLRQSRDSNRISDMSSLTSALGIFSEDQSSGSLGAANTVYVSIPDPTATSTAGDQCQGLGLLTLPAAYSYHCAASSTYRNINGNGWIPVNFSAISVGSPLGSLPIDPINTSSTRNYYTYTTNGSQYELTSVMESQKYKLGGSNDVIGPDGSTLSTVYAKGSNLSLEPLDYGDTSLVGLWSFNEGTGTVAYDYSGNNATGSWNGTATGTSGYYSAGNIGPWAGAFNGNNDYIGLSVSSLYNFTSDLSGFAWIKTSTNGTIFLQYQNVGNTGLIYMDVGPSTVGGAANKFVVYLRTNSGSLGVFSGTTTITDNKWHFVVFTRSASAQLVTLYVDGNVDATSTYTATDGINVSGLSAHFISNNSSYFYQGLIDDVRIYNRALSASEIAAMYAGGK